MINQEIEALKESLRKGKRKIKEEEATIDEGIDARFLSIFKDKEVPEPLKMAYKKSVREIYMERINYKRAALNDIGTRITDLEQKYSDMLA